MTLEELKKAELSDLLVQLSENEKDQIYEEVSLERKRIARRLKERNYDYEEISELTDLELVVVDSLKVDQIKQLLYERKQELSNKESEEY